MGRPLALDGRRLMGDTTTNRKSASTVGARPLGLSLCPAVSGGHDILLGDQFRTKLTYTPPLLHASVELGCKKT